jgi:hypothetical protein
MGQVPKLNRQIHLPPPAANPPCDLAIPLLFANRPKRPRPSADSASEQHFYSTIARMVPDRYGSTGTRVRPSSANGGLFSLRLACRARDG